MEKITDFFKSLKERLSNPLFSSFVLTWLIFNWRIVIGILFYKNSELHLDGYKSYINLINQNSNTIDIVWGPLFSALAYTFLFPFVRNIILAFNEWIKVWGMQWNLKISRDGKVSVTKYIELREIYQKRTLILEDVLKKESEYLSENEIIKNSNMELSNELNNYKAKIKNWDHYNNANSLSGNWIYKWGGQDSLIKKSCFIKISQNVFSFINEDDTESPYKIDYIATNLNMNIVTFSITSLEKDEVIKKISFILSPDDTFYKLTGKNNFDNDVVFERVIISSP